MSGIPSKGRVDQQAQQEFQKSQDEMYYQQIKNANVFAGLLGGLGSQGARIPEVIAQLQQNGIRVRTVSPNLEVQEQVLPSTVIEPISGPMDAIVKNRPRKLRVRDEIL